MQPCEQTATITAIHDTLKRVDRTQERLVEALERVADQGARIENLEDVKDMHHHDIDILYNRLRESDLKLDRIIHVLDMLSSKYVIGFITGLVGMTILGFILDIIYHADTIKLFIKFMNGG